MTSLDPISMPTNNLDVVCRLCLNVSGKLFSLHRKNKLKTKAITLPMKISLCTTVKILNHDMLPQKLCWNCLNYINEWYKFRRRTIKVDAVLRKHVKDVKDAELERKFKFFDIDFEESAEPVEDGNFELFEVPPAVREETCCDEIGIDTNEEYCNETEDPNKTFDIQPTAMMANNSDNKEVHILKSSLPEKVKCMLCSHPFDYFKDLKQHYIQVHKIKEKKNGSRGVGKSGKRDFTLIGRPSYEMKCCGKVFKCKAMFTKHYKKRHPGEKPFMCDVCGKKDFMSEETLRRHKILHTDQHSCDVCGRTFSCNASLQIHKRDKHEDDKPFVCDVCGKRFVTELLLKYHKRFHTGDKQYVCEECGLAVVTSGSLARHKRIHELVKPHVCEICGKGFTMKNRLVGHLMMHSGERPYTCGVCHKGFTMRDKLKRHIRIHSVSKLYPCEFCDNNYATRSGLSMHVRSHMKAL